MPAPEGYIDVAERITNFREKYPEGSLQQVKVEFVKDFGGSDWVVYTAAAYRSPSDPIPAHGSAWERVPGLTNFTRNSELQNAETSAWGRAIVAVGASDTRRGIASKEDVENRQAEVGVLTPVQVLSNELVRVFATKDERKSFVESGVGHDVGVLTELNQLEITALIADLGERANHG